MLVQVRSGPNPKLIAEGCPDGRTSPATAALTAEDSVTLTRTSCFGTCPRYEITVRADGQATCRGKLFVKFAGEHRYDISEAEAKA